MSPIVLWGDLPILNGHGPLTPEEAAEATRIPLELIQRAISKGVLPVIADGPDAGKVPADHFKAPERYGVLPTAPPVPKPRTAEPKPPPRGPG